MTTNGALLTAALPDLVAAGLDRVTVSGNEALGAMTPAAGAGARSTRRLPVVQPGA